MTSGCERRSTLAGFARKQIVSGAVLGMETVRRRCRAAPDRHDGEPSLPGLRAPLVQPTAEQPPTVARCPGLRGRHCPYSAVTALPPRSSMRGEAPARSRAGPRTTDQGDPMPEACEVLLAS